MKRLSPATRSTRFTLGRNALRPTTVEIMWKRLAHLLTLTVLFILVMALPAAAQTDPGEPNNCGSYLGVVCYGWFSDNAEVVDDDAAIEEAVGALVTRYGNQIAVVTVTESPAGSPLEFANDLGNAWGVGDADRQDGIVVLVDVINRRTEMTAGPGVPELDYTRVTGAGNSFFGRGDFDSGIIAIVGSLEQELAFVADGGGTNGEPGGGSGVADSQPADDGPPTGLVIGALAAAGLIGGGVGLGAARHRRRERIGKERTELIDGDVRSLDPAGHELPLIADYAVEHRSSVPAVTTRAALAVLERVAAGIEPQDPETTSAVWASNLVAVVDRDRLLTETEIPLELRVSAEQPLLEGALQAGIRDAVDVDLDDEETFDIRRQELQRIISSLRPHRIANAR